MAGKADCRKSKCVVKNDNHLKPFKITSANSQMLQAVGNGKHNEVASLLESSFDEISTKTLETAVFQTAGNGHKRMLQIFIKYGVNINTKNTKGHTALMLASEHGYLDIVKLLVKNGADVNSKSKNGRTALIFAAEKACSVPVIEFLVSNKCCADINSQDRKGRTALMVSIQLCDIAAMRVLLHHKETDLDLQDKKGNTALDIAKQNGIHEEFCTLQACIGNQFLNPVIVSVMRGNLSLLKEFLDDDHYNIEQTNIDGYTPLMLALKSLIYDDRDKNISKDIIVTLIKNGTDINNMCTVNTKCTPLMWTVESGNLEAVRLLVEHGANINSQTPMFKLSALMTAARKDFSDIVEILLKNGADFSLKDVNSKAALRYALENNAISCVDMLIQYGAEIDGDSLTLAAYMNVELGKYLQFSSVTNKIASSGMCHSLIERCFSSKNYALVEFLLDHSADGNRNLNDLLLAAAAEDAGMAKLLLDRGANVNTESDDGQTALMMAAIWDNRDAIQLLIERKADMNIDSVGDTALTFAIKQKSSNALVALLRGGVDVNYVPQHHHSSIPLHLSVSAGHKDVTELLISYGAHINSVNNMNQTVLFLAFKQRNYDIIGLLIAKGADLDKQTFGGSTLLHISLTILDIRMAEILITAGADVNVADDKGKTALMICSQACTTNIMQLLLNSGAHVNTADESGSTALLYAVKHSILLTEKAEMLLKYGADINKKNGDGHTAFMIASRFCKDNVLRFLIDHGADLNAQDKLGSTALIHDLTSKYGRASQLISMGADVNIQNSLGCTALIIAATNCSCLDMKLLLNAGADVHASDHRTKSTALSIILTGYNKCRSCSGENSIACQHFACLEILINAGAKPDMSNQCMLALYKAVICNQVKLVELLIGCGIPPLEMPRNFRDLLNYSVPQHFFTAICGIHGERSVFDDFLLSLNATVHARSPMSTAIFCKNAAICQLFIKNWYFNEMDMNRKSLNVFHDLISNARTRIAAVCKEIFFQPWSLSTLSFVTVSTCVGSSHDREKRVRVLPIPQILQEKLLFKSTVSDLTISVVENEEEVVNFVQPAHRPLVRLN